MHRFNLSYTSRPKYDSTSIKETAPLLQEERSIFSWVQLSLILLIISLFVLMLFLRLIESPGIKKKSGLVVYTLAVVNLDRQHN